MCPAAWAAEMVIHLTVKSPDILTLENETETAVIAEDKYTRNKNGFQ